MFCSCLFYFISIFSDFCQTNYLNIYQTDLHEICRIGRTLAVDERAEVSFSILQGALPHRSSPNSQVWQKLWLWVNNINLFFSIREGTLPWQPILWALSTEFSSSPTTEFLSSGNIHQMAVSISEKWCNMDCWAKAKVMHESE